MNINVSIYVDIIVTELIYSSVPGRGGTTVSSSGAVPSKQDLEKI